MAGHAAAAWLPEHKKSALLSYRLRQGKVDHSTRTVLIISDLPTKINTGRLLSMNKDKPAYWAVIPASVRYDTQIPANAKLLFAEISALTGETGYCYATNDYFSNLYGLSGRSITRLLSILSDRGMIRIEDGDGGASVRRIYAGLNPLSGVADPPTKMSTPLDKNVGGPPTKMSTGIINNNTIPPITPQRGDASAAWKPERFEGLWKFYPHPSNDRKSRARKVWDRLRLDDATIDTLARCLRYDMEGEEWQRGIGIPHLSTYLNQRAWEDALDRMAEEAPEDDGGWADDPEEI